MGLYWLSTSMFLNLQVQPHVLSTSWLLPEVRSGNAPALSSPHQQLLFWKEFWAQLELEGTHPTAPVWLIRNFLWGFLWPIPITGDGFGLLWCYLLENKEWEWLSPAWQWQKKPTHHLVALKQGVSGNCSVPHREDWKISLQDFQRNWNQRVLFISMEKGWIQV